MTKSEKDIIIIKKGAEYDKQNEKSYLRGGGHYVRKTYTSTFKSSPTFTGRATCVKHVPVPFKSSPTFTGRATCVAHDKNLSTYSLNVLETDKTPTLSRICKFAYRSLTNSTLSQRERVKYGYTLAEVFSPCRKVKLSFGFTLAEVLITLGIIGIVAALTLPSLVNKYRIKQLEVAFKRTNSIVEQALLKTAQEFGYANIKDLNDICGKLPENQTGSCVTANKPYFDEINEFFISQFYQPMTVTMSVLFHKPPMLIPFNGKEKVAPYSNLYGACYDGAAKCGYLLPDGTFVSKIVPYHHGKYDGMTITFDTNGPYKRPNRLGYDIFFYNTGTWWKVCTAKGNDSQLFNSRACYNYALQDKNPDDNTKGYWESLKF